MANIKQKLGDTGQTITVTLASLANGGARESTAIDNRTNLFLDALVQLKIKAPASGTATTGYVQIYAYGTSDDGTTYGEGATGTDAALTLTSPTNLRPLGRMNIVADGVTYRSNPMSVAAAFGGVLPAKWGIVVENQTGGTLDSVEGSHAKLYQGIYAQTV